MQNAEGLISNEERASKNSGEPETYMRKQLHNATEGAHGHGGGCATRWG